MNQAVKEKRKLFPGLPPTSSGSFTLPSKSTSRRRNINLLPFRSTVSTCEWRGGERGPEQPAPEGQRQARPFTVWAVEPTAKSRPRRVEEDAIKVTHPPSTGLGRGKGRGLSGSSARGQPKLPTAQFEGTTTRRLSQVRARAVGRSFPRPSSSVPPQFPPPRDYSGALAGPFIKAVPFPSDPKSASGRPAQFSPGA